MPSTARRASACGSLVVPVEPVRLRPTRRGPSAATRVLRPPSASRSASSSRSHARRVALPRPDPTEADQRVELVHRRGRDGQQLLGRAAPPRPSPRCARASACDRRAGTCRTWRCRGRRSRPLRRRRPVLPAGTRAARGRARGSSRRRARPAGPGAGRRRSATPRPCVARQDSSRWSASTQALVLSASLRTSGRSRSAARAMARSAKAIASRCSAVPRRSPAISVVMRASSAVGPSGSRMRIDSSAAAFSSSPRHSRHIVREYMCRSSPTRSWSPTSRHSSSAAARWSRGLLPVVDERALVRQQRRAASRGSSRRRRPRSAARARTGQPPRGARPARRSGDRRPGRARRTRSASPAPSAWNASRASSVTAGRAQRLQDRTVDRDAAVRAGWTARPPAGRSRAGTAAGSRPRRAGRPPRSSSVAAGLAPRGRVQDGGVDARADQSRDLDGRACLRAQGRDPGQHRVARRRRQRPGAAAQHLGHEERVAAGEPVHVLRRRGRCPGPARAPLRGSAAGRRPAAWPAGWSARRARRAAGRSAGRASSRKVTTSSVDALRTRRPRNRSRSRVASSAQCTSSTTSTVNVPGSSSWRSSAAKSWSRGAPACSSSGSSPPRSLATSTTGASARGVNRPSQAPQYQRASGTCCSRRSTRVDLPTPASPATSTSRP